MISFTRTVISAMEDLMKIITPRDFLGAKIENIFSEKPTCLDDHEFVLDSYSEGWRTYHNCNHVLKMLQILDNNPPELEAGYIQAIEAMIVYHDVVYKIGRQKKGWNERESAVIAGKQLQAAGYDGIFIDIVVTGIKCTIDHTVPEIIENWSWFIAPFLDIDLHAGLGESSDDFANNTELIREEYSPLYTDAEYASGRAKWAEDMLKRPSIYLTSHFQQYEAYARENLERLVTG